MPPKNQHFVPKVYLKAWETKVATSKEPNKKFDGVYYYTNGMDNGEGSTGKQFSGSLIYIRLISDSFIWRESAQRFTTILLMKFTIQ